MLRPIGADEDSSRFQALQDLAGVIKMREMALTAKHLLVKDRGLAAPSGRKVPPRIINAQAIRAILLATVWTVLL